MLGREQVAAGGMLVNAGGTISGTVFESGATYGIDSATASGLCASSGPRVSARARWLRYAAFFVGVSSGLSWLAWAAGVPVVMISGFTQTGPIEPRKFCPDEFIAV